MILFHRFLIGTFILFCLGFAAWSLLAFRASGGTTALVLGISFLGASAAFAYYLKHLHRFLGR